MRFLADMGLSPKTVSFLRDAGYDAVHLHDQELDRLADSAILEKARTEGRVLLTHDLDFGELMAASGAALPSVVIFRLRDMRPPNVNRHLDEILTEYRKLLEDGAIASITEGRIRVRPLPIKPGK
jgi:predicted nuclease of predicted toxin-antitoxin system